MSTAVRRLLAEVASDRATLGRHLDSLERLDLGERPAHDGTLAQAAWALHHGYSAVESVLERIARVIEQSVPVGADFHKALLDAAALEIPGVRPPLLGRDTVLGLHDLRAFRHFVRHAYAVDLDVERLAGLQERARRLRPLLERDLDTMERWLALLADATGADE